jgi:hypothetical protein
MTPCAAFAVAPVATLSDLASVTGLTERQVKMVVGAHTAYPEYLRSYDWTRRKFVHALGEQRYDDLMAGREIVLDDGRRLAFTDR